MKKVFFLSLFLALIVIMPAEAQFKLGIRAGANMSSLKFNKEVKSSNVAGFTGGVMAEFIIPGLGFGLDGAVMYTRRGSELKFSDIVDAAGNVIGSNKSTTKLDYIEIPVNLKYKLGLPLVKPYIFAGPSFAFLVGDKISERFKERNFDTSINVGAGLELLGKVQISAQYGWGLNKTLKVKTLDETLNGKNRYWTITAAYLF